ncbi:efflux RND transporter periplasmic adaptor subunit [Marinobacterium sp. YM272]|uniref:efflux RND transporter periplasmic adaptor subunit n=1 Tax=Marinobacterium sp. YM272 TaxID=3421654 RepID=UPI003D7F3263
MKRALILLLILLPIAAALWYFSRPTPIPVELSVVSTGSVEVIAANSRAGSIRACQRSRLSVPTGGRVDHLLVDEGDRVKTGDLLLRLLDDEQQALLRGADADLKAARLAEERSCQLARFSQRELVRSRALAERKLVSDEQLDRLATDASVAAIACDQAKVAIEQASARYSLYSAQLEKMHLRAPFAGIIAEINGEPGEYTTPSPPGVATPPAVDLIDDSCLYVRAPIDEVEAAQLAPGQTARITLDAFRGREFSGTLKRIAPFVSELEKQARTVDVDVYFNPLPEDTLLLVGYSADVEVIVEQHPQQLRVPTEALLEGNSVLRFDADSSTLQKVNVEIGPANWTWTAISAGLEEGDRILTRLDTEGAVEGARVEPQ